MKVNGWRSVKNVAVALVAVLLMCGYSYAGGTTFGITSVKAKVGDNSNPNNISSIAKRMAVEGQTIYIVYQSPNSSGGLDVKLTQFSIDEMAAGSTEVVAVAPDAYYAYGASVAVGSGRIHVVWSEWDSTISQMIAYYTHRDINSTYWSAKTSVGTGYYPSIVANDAGDVVVYTSGYTTSTDNGDTWDEINAPGSFQNSLAMDDQGNLYVTYTNYYVYFSKRDAITRNWSTPAMVSSINNSGSPRIALYGGNIYIAWARAQEPGQPRGLYVSSSSDGGATWTPNTITDDSLIASAYGIDLAVDQNGTLNLVWGVWLNSTQYELYFARSRNGVSNWTVPLSVIQNTYSHALIDVDSAGKAYILFSNYNPITAMYLTAEQ